MGGGCASRRDTPLPHCSCDTSPGRPPPQGGRALTTAPTMSTSRSAALELKGVSAGYGETVVLEDVNLGIAPGESISVIGRNGVGKTTLLATIMGHTTLHKGDVMQAGRSLNHVPVYRRAAAGLGF